MLDNLVVDTFKGVPYTTITEIARSLSEGDASIQSQIRKAVSQEVGSNVLREGEDFIKIEREHFDYIGSLKPIDHIGNVLILIHVGSVERLVDKIIFKVKQMKQGDYTVDRFKGKKRTPNQELVYILDKNEMKLEKKLFTAVTLSMFMMETVKATKARAIKYAANKHDVKQTEIKKVLELVQYEMGARDKAQKSYGQKHVDQYIAVSNIKKKSE